MVTDVGEIATESAAFTVTVAVLDVAVTPTESVTFTQMELEPTDEGEKVHFALVAPDTATPLRYH
jgi:hypothetical protein